MVVTLHVGPVKTGSTFLQQLVWEHRHDLARQGWTVPLDHANEMWLASIDLQDGAFVHVEVPSAHGAWPRICARVRAADQPTLLSHELLGMCTDAHIAAIVAAFGRDRLRVVVMARALANLLPSIWQEKVKMIDPDISWADYLTAERETRAPGADASVIAERWLRHLSPAQLRVVTVPPYDGGRRVLLDRFAAAVGFDAASWHGADRPANPSLDRVQAELVRYLTRTSGLPRAQLRTWIHTVVLPALGNPDPAQQFRVPSSERAWIEDETRRRISWLERSGVPIHGELAELHAPPDVWSDEDGAPTDRELLQRAATLLERAARPG